MCSEVICLSNRHFVSYVRNECSKARVMGNTQLGKYLNKFKFVPQVAHDKDTYNTSNISP